MSAPRGTQATYVVMDSKPATSSVDSDDTEANCRLEDDSGVEGKTRVFGDGDNGLQDGLTNSDELSLGGDGVTTKTQPTPLPLMRRHLESLTGSIEDEASNAASSATWDDHVAEFKNDGVNLTAGSTNSSTTNINSDRADDTDDAEGDGEPTPEEESNGNGNSQNDLDETSSYGEKMLAECEARCREPSRQSSGGLLSTAPAVKRKADTDEAHGDHGAHGADRNKRGRNEGAM